MIEDIEVGENCVCPMDENTITLSAFSRHCPDHGHLAPKATTIIQRWCDGSSEVVDFVSKKTGRCRRCRQVIPSKYGIASVHLPDGSTPRE